MFSGGAFGYLADYAVWWVLYLSLLVHTWCFFRFFPRKRLVKSGLLLGNALVFACMSGLVALVAETYFRFLCVETDAFGMSLPARRWFALHTRLNSLGCRDREWTPMPQAKDNPDSSASGAEVRRIAFVGDSFTYGWGIERVEDRFSDRIQAMFDRRAANRKPQPSRPAPISRSVRSPVSISPERKLVQGKGAGAEAHASGDRKGAGKFRRVEVMNVAKPGWDTGAQLQPVKDMIAVYGVDEVVLCYVPNDIEKLLPRSPDFDPVRPPQPTFFNPSASCLVDYLYHRLVVPRVPTVRRYHDWLAEGFADPAIWRLHQQQLYEIIRYCRDHDVTLRVVLLPYIRTGGEKYDARRIHAMLRGFFEANGVEVLDLLPVIADYDPHELVVNRQDPHPNEKANELFAEAIWQAFYEADER